LRTARSIAIGFFLLAPLALPQQPDQVLVVANRKSPVSRQIADYYIGKRAIPLANLCIIDTDPAETIPRENYARDIEPAVSNFLRTHNLIEKVLYIVLTSGVPLQIEGNGAGLNNTGASVDSELTLLYGRLHGQTYPIAGALANPFYRQRDTPFRHPTFPIYLVTRLAAWDLAEMKGLVDRSLAARNIGKIVFDLRADENTDGNQWMRTAALLLPKDRVILDDTAKILTGIQDVIGYASWGSNDRDRKHRFTGFHWLAGGLAIEYVSSDARSFQRPPDSWELGNWNDKKTYFAGTPQSLTSDLLHEGATAATGHVDEPYLHLNPRPDYVFPAYIGGRNLAESVYIGIPGLSWMNVVIGDPLMKLLP
jgi:uncharacterized protein (TIGR03790 family)